MAGNFESPRDTTLNPKQLATLAARLPEPEHSQFVELMTEANKHAAQAEELRRQADLEIVQAKAISTVAWGAYHSVVPLRAIMQPKIEKPTPITPDVETFIAHLKSYVSRTGNNCFSMQFIEEHRTDIMPMSISRNEARRLIKAARACGAIIEVKNASKHHTMWRLA
jgi:hypothetical protein